MIMMQDLNFSIPRLGECRIDTPLQGLSYVRDDERVLWSSDLGEVKSCLNQGHEPPAFEVAGPREKIFVDPSRVTCGIVTCGGLCPGLNDVVRSIVMSLHYHYGVKHIYGFPYGFEGLTRTQGHAPMELSPGVVSRIHERGGTILGSSRGHQEIGEMVDTLERMRIGILFTIGGDGTLRGAHAIAEEVKRRGLLTSVIGIPKTIDNDISYVQTSFGFQTAVSEARRATYAAHSEAEGARNGIGLVKLMGRDSGFIAAYAALADSQVNICLVPELPFTLEGLLSALKARLDARGHAVVVVAEGAGSDLPGAVIGKDASGNVRYRDIGVLLKGSIQEYFASIGMDISLRYIDPSYTIRSLPANAFDSAFCLLLGHNAVHAGMAGRTDMVVGSWKNAFTHVPIPLAVSARKKIEPDGWLWRSVLMSTGQPSEERWS
jgi:6-phosphofructokinase 1